MFGFGRHSFSSHLVAPAFGLFKKPPSISFEDAATLPVAAVTVYYSLHYLAHLRKGERILIHGAAGGVGLAAIQFAQSVGAEIFASAGTVEKRDFLRRLGVQHVVNSRTLRFSDEITEITGGEGIDIVLNSVAGEAIARGLSVLRPHGRFIELGKRDFYANSKLGLQVFRNNIQFFGVDVDRLLVDRPALARDLFAELAPVLDARVFVPLPHRVFPISRADEAFRCMQQSRHIGKIVLKMDGIDRAPITGTSGENRLTLSPDATYLVTGGRGGFGLATAEWLARKGARHLVVVGRSPVVEAGSAAPLQQLRRSGINVCEIATDVADANQVAELLNRMRRTMPPLRGVIHCAAVIQDASLVNTTVANFHDVLRPKVAGAWNLHRQTLDDKLDFFVMYSSATTLFGNEGQVNYVAANLYLEALASHRRGLGLAGLAVGWGAISEVGHITRHAGLMERLKERIGVKMLPPARALDDLERAIVADAAHVALVEINWSRLAKLPGIGKDRKYELVGELLSDTSNEGAEANLEELRARLAGLPYEEAVSFVQQLLIRHVAAVVRMAPSKLAIDRPLAELGMDSLMLVELQMDLEKQFGAAISTLELMDMSTVAKLGSRIIEKIGIAPAIISPEDGTGRSQAWANTNLRLSRRRNRRPNPCSRPCMDKSSSRNSIERRSNRHERDRTRCALF